MPTISPGIIAVLLAVTLVPASAAAQGPSAERGKSVFDAGGCLACHTDLKNKGEPLAGGPPLKTPFGTFYAPNISPDRTHGIGGWTDVQFVRAMREGVGPDGRHYYPVFPYTSYTKATEQDLRDLKAYIMTLAPVAKPSRPHDVGFPFSIRLTLLPWKWLNFTPGEWKPDPSKDAVWNRGAYLTEALTHCGECHTPRNLMGGIDRKRWMSGSADGPDGEKVPNITPDASGIGKWSVKDIEGLLSDGGNPDGDYVGGSMGEVVAHSSSKLSAADRNAIAVYFKSLPALPSAVPKKK
ncbi:MAG: c-type cytochrome [Alphaproteobacteria bacterium]|nr:c-type cytochrome [Alphaproteobacteria bacterium]